MFGSKRKQGWIGVDVGTSALKIAQVSRDGDAISLNAAAIVPRQTALNARHSTATPPISSINELVAAQSLQDGYQGRTVAASLPMALCDIHRLELDLNAEPNAEVILRRAIETATQQSAVGLQCDFWSAPATDSKPAWSQAITVSQDWTEQMCEDVASAGWLCEAIDGQPLAMARAVSMNHHDTDEPAACLDWGNDRAILCFVENGQPTYVRKLKLPGLGSVTNKITETLELSVVEAQRILEEHGLAGNESSEASVVGAMLAELLTEELGTLISELKRSFSHIQYVRRTASPKFLYLLGGGAMIKNLDSVLSTQLGIKAANWHLPGEHPSNGGVEYRAECLFATAIALSTLAWEPQ